jgi:hypothetical protein
MTTIEKARELLAGASPEMRKAVGELIRRSLSVGRDWGQFEGRELGDDFRARCWTEWDKLHSCARELIETKSENKENKMENENDEKSLSEENKMENENDEKSLSEVLPESIFKAIHVAIGEASMCWENVDKAGVFDSERARKIAYKLCWDIVESPEIKIATSIIDPLKVGG